MNISEAHEVTKLLRYLDGSLPNTRQNHERAVEAARVLADRASKALQLRVDIDVDGLRRHLAVMG